MTATADQSNGRGKWVTATSAHPCPVCGKADWCRISADGRVAACRRQEQGCYRTQPDRTGTPVYLHNVAGGPRPADVPPQPPGPTARRADADTLHKVYSALLGRLKLSEPHRTNLRGRGLTDEAIDRNQYRTLPVPGRARIAHELRQQFGDALLKVPGFAFKERDGRRYLTLVGAAGLLVPVRDPAGRVVGLKIRRDVPGDAGGKYLWLSSARHAGPGPTALPHVPLGAQLPVERVRLGEGPLKCDVATALGGLVAVAAPGVSTWRVCLSVLKEMGVRTVRLSFDADCRTNPAVARALLAAALGLAAEGYALELETWDAAEGKGIDDVLAAGKVPAVLQGEAAREAARAIAEEAGVKGGPGGAELDRLEEVLAVGGAAALFRDEAILTALARLAVEKPAEYAARRASLKEVVGARDLDRVLRPLVRRAQAEQTTLVSEEPLTYSVQGGRICRNALTQGGAVVVPLCNFAARITEEVTRDDGAERSVVLALEGQLADGRLLPRAEVAADAFPLMGWVTAAWGAGAVVFAGIGTRDHVRCALQVLSPSARRRTRYTHGGWREVDGQWVYLHAGGAIGPDGPAEGVETELPEALARYELPAPPTGESRVVAVRSSLGLLDGLAPDAVAFSLLAATYRAVLGDVDFSVHLAGPTGCFKSETTALAQQHFGPGLDARHLPASWSSTGNALEGIAFAAKDALLTVDDFAPSGSTGDVQRLHREADRLLRAQGNRTGRSRMRADATLKPSKPPRGLVLSTGEDVPHGQSLRSRLLVVEMSPGDVKSDRLTCCQQDAAAGLYAQALAGFIHWLAPRYAEVRGRLRQEQATLRERVRVDGQHARTPGITADLALGLRYFLDFAKEVGAVTPAEAATLWERGLSALLRAAADQAAQIAVAEPTGQFLRLLMAALGSGRAHVAGPSGTAPRDAGAWGWRANPGDGGTGRPEWQAQGRRIGWLDGDDLYLEPEAAYAEAQRLAGDQGGSLPVAPRTLLKRLHERNLLAAVEAHGGKTRFTVRRTLEGQRREVIFLRADALSPPAGAPSAPEGGRPHDAGPGTGRNGPQQGDHPVAAGCAHGAPRVSPQDDGADHSAREADPLAHPAHSAEGEGASPVVNGIPTDNNGWGDWQ